MDSTIISLVSVTIAVAAVGVSTWQVRATARSSERAHTLPVISETFREFRSAEFRARVSYVATRTPAIRGVRSSFRANRGFSSLPRKWRENAYEVCYFFDYLGALVKFGIIREEFAISLWGTGIMRVWLAAEPFIVMERLHRKETFSKEVSPGFLTYYEDLVCRIMDRGGQDAPRQIQAKTGLHKLGKPLSKKTDLRRWRLING